MGEQRFLHLYFLSFAFKVETSVKLITLWSWSFHTIGFQRFILHKSAHCSGTVESHLRALFSRTSCCGDPVKLKLFLSPLNVQCCQMLLILSGSFRSSDDIAKIQFHPQSGKQWKSFNTGTLYFSYLVTNMPLGFQSAEFREMSVYHYEQTRTSRQCQLIRKKCIWLYTQKYILHLAKMFVKLQYSDLAVSSAVQKYRRNSKVPQ